MSLIQGHYSADFGVLLHEDSKANVEKRAGCIRGYARAGEVDDCQLRRLDQFISAEFMFSSWLSLTLGVQLEPVLLETAIFFFCDLDRTAC